jgi:hypothetical protein
MIKRKHINAALGTKVAGDGKPGRYIDPSSWKTGPDIEVRQKYYAYMKHKSQAHYRKEQHELTWDEWNQLWTPTLWEQRGRTVACMILTRVDTDLAWRLDNCIVCSRREHIDRIKESKTQ